MAPAEDSRADDPVVERLLGLGVLAGAVAHDLRNLALALVVETGLLARNFPSGPGSRESLDAVAEAGAALERIAARLADAGGIPVAALDCRETLLEAARAAEPARGCRTRTRVEVDAALPAVIGSRPAFRAAVRCLLVDACRAVGDRPGEVSLRARATSDRREVRIEVTDDGPGDPRADIPDLAAAASGPRDLGWMIALRAARLGGGELRIEPLEPRGTRVSLLLPVASPGPGGDDADR